jgi:hypothetical protein
MKYLMILSLCLSFTLLQTKAFAQKIPPQQRQEDIPYDDTFGGGNDEFEFEKFDNLSILVAIKRDMEMACDKAGLCTLSAVTSNDRRFTASFNIGVGNQMGGYGGTTTGTTVIIPGANTTTENEPYYGVSLRFTTGRCTQNVKVPRALYISMNRYMYGLMTEEGGTRRGFTPADEAMIMFYSTIMKQATGCVAGQ